LTIIKLDIFIAFLKVSNMNQDISYLTTFILSSELFWGFSVTININDFCNNEEIIKYIKKELKAFLMIKNLQLLVEKVNTLELHMHDEFENLKLQNIWYICDHKH
jgi:hypothetical protein